MKLNKNILSIFILLFCSLMYSQPVVLHYSTYTGELGCDRVNRLYCDKTGIVYSATQKGIFVFGEDGFTLMDPEIQFPVEFITGGEEKLFFSSSNRLYEFYRDKLSVLSVFPEEHVITGIFSVFPKKTTLDYELWVSTQNGLWHIDVSGEKKFFSSKDGLPSSYVTCVTGNSDTIYAGTAKGIVKIKKGFAIEKINGLKHSFVTDIVYDDSKDELWAGTLFGLHQISGGQVRFYLPFNSGLTQEKVNGIYLKNGFLYVAGDNGISKVKDGHWKKLELKKLDPDSVAYNCITVNENGIWAGDFTQGIVLISETLARLRQSDVSLFAKYKREVNRNQVTGPVFDKEWVNFDLSQGLPSLTINDIYVDNMANDGKKYLWVATVKGIARFDGLNWQVFNTENTGFLSENIKSIAVEPVMEGQKKIYYFATSGGGLLWFDGERWGSITESNGLSSNFVNIVIFDNNRIIAGTRNGISIIRSRNIRVYRREDGLLNNSVYSLATEGKYLWIGTELGISRMDRNDRFRNYTSWEGLPGLKVTSLAVFKDGLYAGMFRNGIWIIRNNIISSLNSDFDKEAVNTLVSIGNSTVLGAGTEKGIQMFINRKEIKVPYGEKFFGKSVTTIREDGEFLWIGTYRNGLFRIKYR